MTDSPARRPPPPAALAGRPRPAPGLPLRGRRPGGPPRPPMGDRRTRARAAAEHTGDPDPLSLTHTHPDFPHLSDTGFRPRVPTQATQPDARPSLTGFPSLLIGRGRSGMGTGAPSQLPLQCTPPPNRSQNPHLFLVFCPQPSTTFSVKQILKKCKHPTAPKFHHNTQINSKALIN